MIKYYKNDNNDLFVDPIIENHLGLVEISKEDFDSMLVLINRPTKEQIENEFRFKRDNLLNTIVDRYQKPLVWETLTVEQQDKVRVYRQALLDSTTNWILPEELVL